MKLLHLSVYQQNAPWGAECFLDAAFERIGVELIRLDYREHRKELAERFLSYAREGFDGFLLQRGDGFPLPLIEAVNRPRVLWATELVARRRDQDRLLKSGLFDRMLLRGDNCIDAVLENGWTDADRLGIMLSSFDPVIHRPVPAQERDIELLFVGSMKDRRKRILGLIEKKVPVTYARAFMDEMAALFGRARIVLNIHAEAHIDTETRVFEVLGSGAFLLTERLGRESPFESGRHLVEVDTVEEMGEAAEYYLTHPEERERIATAGQEAALANHTYEHRARQFQDLFSRLLQERPPAGPPIDEDRVKRYLPRQKLANMTAPLVSLSRRVGRAARRRLDRK